SPSCCCGVSSICRSRRQSSNSLPTRRAATCRVSRSSTHDSRARLKASRATTPNAVDPDLVNGKALLGLRIPVVVASPFTRGNRANPRVDSTVYDNTSILKLIEWRWNLKPLTARDASNDVGNLAFALNLAHPDATVPALPTPIAPPVQPCPPGFPVPTDLTIEDLLALVP